MPQLRNVPPKPKAPKYLMDKDGFCYAFNPAMAQQTELYVAVDAPEKAAAKGKKRWAKLYEEQERARQDRKRAIKEASDERISRIVLVTPEEADTSPYEVEDEPQDQDPVDTESEALAGSFAVPPQDEPEPKKKGK